MKTTIVAALAAFTLAGCAGNTQGPGAGEALGSIVGAVLGGVAGNNVGDGSGQKLAIAVGAILGGLAGNWTGRNVDENLRRKQQLALQHTLDTGYTATYRHEGTVGRFGPGAWSQQGGETCREYTHTVNVGGREERAYGRACRDDAGDWRVVR